MNRQDYEHQLLGLCPDCGKPVLRSHKKHRDGKNETWLHWDCFIKRCKRTNSLGSRSPTDSKPETDEYYECER